MDYYGNIKAFIFEIIEENLDGYLINWDKDDFSEEELKYITLEMGKINTEDFFYDKFNSYNDNCRELFSWYREPTAKEYYNLLEELVEKFDDYDMSLNKAIKEKNYEQSMELIIGYLADDLINEFNNNRKEDIKYEIKQRKKAIITIQRAFKKYRYTPCYKFCKLVQAKNLLLDNCISQEEFGVYLKNINIK